MKKAILFFGLLIVHGLTFSQEDHVWSFDCDSSGWGEVDNVNSFKITYEFQNASINSSHLKLVHDFNDNFSWLFGPTNENIDADTYKYVHFSLSVENANIPVNGINALFVWDTSADGQINDIRSKSFKIYNGQTNYTIDLSQEVDWSGTVNINRMHLPNGGQTASGYTPVSAVYRLDWVALSSNSTPTVPSQDTDSSCTPVTPILSNDIESVIFGNRVSIKSSYTGSKVDATFKLWPQGTNDTIVTNQRIDNGGVFYMSQKELNTSTTYNYLVTLENPAGRDVSSVNQFTTESQTAESYPTDVWMTPTPFDLIQNANDDLLDNNTWPQSASMANVYKIHGATFRASTAPEFFAYDFSKLIYTCNKFKMRIALESVISGNNSGEKYAESIVERVDQVNDIGGKIEFLTWDGMMFRCFYDSAKNTNFRTPEEGLEEVAVATEIVKQRYPGFEIIPLPNLPNWDIRDSNGDIVPHNGGGWAAKTGVISWDYLCDIYLSKIATRGISISHIEIDHPYYYYTKNGTDLGNNRLNAIKDYCTTNGLELSVIVNQSTGGVGFPGNSQETQDALFKEGCVDYIRTLRSTGINPTRIDIESWYEFPQYLVPETQENSFTNVIKEVGQIFNADNLVFYVDGTLTTGANDGSTWENAFRSGRMVQLAINAASNGDEIRIASGSITDDTQITVNKSVTITGGYDPGSDTRTGFTTLTGVNTERRLVINGNLTIDLNYLIIENGGNTKGAGALIQANASPIFNNVQFINNIATNNGGAISIPSDASAIFKNVVFSGNNANNGAAVHVNGNNSELITFTNVVFANNTSSSRGGGIDNFSSATLNLNSCTFYGNTAVNGSGMFLGSSSTAVINNTVFYGNLANGNPQAFNAQDFTKISGSSNIASDTQAGTSISDNSSNYIALTSDPFTDSSDVDGADNVFATSDDGLFPAENGQLVGAGDGTYNSESVDVIGGVRIVEIIDIGAYESSETLNVENLNEESFTTIIYPNPVKAELNIKIQSNTNNLKIEINDITGKIVFKGSYNDMKNIKLPLGRLSNGLYLLSITSENLKQSHKFLVDH